MQKNLVIYRSHCHKYEHFKNIALPPALPSAWYCQECEQTFRHLIGFGVLQKPVLSAMKQIMDVLYRAPKTKYGVSEITNHAKA